MQGRRLPHRVSAASLRHPSRTQRSGVHSGCIPHAAASPPRLRPPYRRGQLGGGSSGQQFECQLWAALLHLQLQVVQDGSLPIVFGGDQLIQPVLGQAPAAAAAAPPRHLPRIRAAPHCIGAAARASAIWVRQPAAVAALALFGWWAAAAAQALHCRRLAAAAQQCCRCSAQCRGRCRATATAWHNVGGW